ncbi:MAG: cation-translocating P-type ATPase, partial [bacterium]
MNIISAPWKYSIDDIIEKYQVSLKQGLSASELSKRKQKYGKNILKEKEEKSVWQILLNQVKSIIMALLVVAALVSFLFGEIIQALAIVAVIIVTIIIGFSTELRAIRSMESLKDIAQVNAVVKREGSIQKISAKQLVPGDIVIFDSGDIVTADLRLFEANKLQSDESALTGESVPVSKSTQKLPEDTSLEERENMLFKGTMITKGSGKGIVVSTGMETELGKISTLVEEAEEEITPLEERIKILGRKLVWVTLLISACVGVIGFLQGKEVLLMIETSIALAVAAIPEGLPIVATIALAQGMLQMAKQNALINKLSSVETLGSTNVIFSDKTGTLTLNKMQVTRINLQSGTFKFFSENQQDEKRSKDNQDFLSKKDEDVMEALKIGVLCNNASLSTDNNEESEVGDPLEVALLEAGKKVDLLRDELIKQLPEKREVAFDPELKMMATVHKENNSFYVAVKGAPEAVLEHSSSIKKDNGSTFTEDDKEGWLEKNQEMAEDGLRVLAVAFKKATEENVDVYENLTFIGLLGLLDPPRKEVKEYIEACQNAGIRLIMVTGDHPATAQNVAKEISLIDEDKDQVMLGKDLGSDESLPEDKKDQLIQHSLFARVSPEQKLDL